MKLQKTEEKYFYKNILASFVKRYEQHRKEKDFDIDVFIDVYSDLIHEYKQN